MIEIKIKLEDNVFEPIRNIPLNFIEDVNSLVQLSAQDIRSTIVRNLSGGQRTGNYYKRGSVRHQASAPGEWPKTDTGRLVGSIRTDYSFLSADVGSDVVYSSFLETGTKFMKPRPWLSRGYEESISKIQTKVDDLLKRVFKIL